MTDIRHRKADKVRPTGEVVVRITPPFCHSFLRPMTTSLITIPRRRPVLNLRFIGWVYLQFSQESFAHQRVIYRWIRIKSQSPSELAWTLLWTDLGYFLRNGNKKKKKCGAARAENSKQYRFMTPGWPSAHEIT